MTRPASLRVVGALMLVLATIVFVIGIAVERSVAGEASEVRPAETAATSGNEASEEAAEEGAEGHDESEEAEEANEAEGEGADARAAEGAEPHSEEREASETILGINPESTGAIAVAVVISLLLAATLWFWGTPAVLGTAIVFALFFAALDLREVAHQVSEARSGLAALALLAAVLHVGVAAVAGLALTRRDSPAGTSAA
jgi:hypothetical protein